MKNNIFSKSEKFSSEYCCSIVKIGEVKPIEGKDMIGYTLVNGETIVVRKDQVKEGDVLLYASNETQLNKTFLGANNLFESASYELNANKVELAAYITANKELKSKIENWESIIKKLEFCSRFVINYEAERLTVDNNTEEKKLEKQLHNVIKTIKKYNSGCTETEVNNEYFVAKAKEAITNIRLEIGEIKKEIEKHTSFIRKNVGFFNKTGRVRAIRLGGVRSMGYLFSLDELAKYNPKVKEVNLEGLIGEDFDTVDGELFVKAYVPFVPQRENRGDGRSRDRKRNKKIEKFDRMVKGEFTFHYSTDPLPKCINRINPNDVVAISLKLHGTSLSCGKLHVKTPIKLPIHKRVWNWFVDTTSLFKDKRITDYIIEYGNVTSSRTVIKNQYINNCVTDGYYGADIWSEYGDLIYPYLEEGMTIYGEIFGYVTGSDKMIQKGYDYGCETGENKLMIYRITTTKEDGTKQEWNVSEVKEWTEKLITDYPELSERIHVIDLLYHGTLTNLYPDVSLTEHWHENILEKMRNDVEHFGMEKREPLCKSHNVFREGICLRIDNDEINETFKLKCRNFLDVEAKLMTDIAEGKEEISEEMQETYS